jgi:hypothetical protein
MPTLHQMNCGYQRKIPPRVKYSLIAKTVLFRKKIENQQQGYQVIFSARGYLKASVKQVA